MSAGDAWPAPPTPRTAAGELRRVGFELEFSGTTLADTVAAVSAALGAEPVEETVAESRLEVDGLGEFVVELDWAFLKRKAAEAGEEDNDEQYWLEFVSRAAALLVPIEVVCPPIPIDRLGELDPMLTALREAGAVGTEESLLAAYGVHINTEMPATDSATLHRYLRAYALLQWWLVDAHDVDPARKLSPYIDLYPEDYLHRVLSREQPDLGQIIDDYLEFNATRNRALDLLPILKHLDAARIEAAIDDPRVNARPAFHYRLPNCHIERADWSLTAAWRKWLLVERLAENEPGLDELALDFERARRPLLKVNRKEWVKYIGQWLIDHGSA